MTTTFRFPLMRNNILREDLDAVISHLKQPDPKLTNGPAVVEFERQWSEWLGVRHSTFVNSGASANFISMLILRQLFPEGGEIIVPTITWVSDIVSVLHTGFEPVFVDISMNTLGMSQEHVLASLTPRTRAVFVTHAQGFNAFEKEFIDELHRRNVLLVEDVCESHGAKCDDIRLGSFGAMSNFSFYYAHHMSTIEGGMVCTNDPKVHQLARLFRAHGMVRESSDPEFRSEFQLSHPDLNPDFIFAVPGLNFRGTEIGGILGQSQLSRLDGNIRRRNENHALFLELIDSEIYFTDFKVAGSSNYAFNLILRKPNSSFRDRLVEVMRREGIEHRRGSAGGGNQLRQPYLRGVVPTDHFLKLPNADHVHFYGFYLGNYPELSVQEVREICEIINSCR